LAAQRVTLATYFPTHFSFAASQRLGLPMLPTCASSAAA
jgi:hypothetical protein